MSAPFTEFRLDGWPLCPRCGEDELMSWHIPGPPNYRDELPAYVEAGMLCLRCRWELQRAPSAPTADTPTIVEAGS